MSRSGYIDDYDEQWHFAMWRGAVRSTIRGKRGQAFLREMLAALYALPEKRLIRHELVDEYDGAVCALGSVGRARRLDMSKIDPEDNENVAGLFSISHALACEVMWLNDEAYHPPVGGDWLRKETPEERWLRIRNWIVDHIIDDAPLSLTSTVEPGASSSSKDGL